MLYEWRIFLEIKTGYFRLNAFVPTTSNSQLGSKFADIAAKSVFCLWRFLVLQIEQENIFIELHSCGCSLDALS